MSGARLCVCLRGITVVLQMHLLSTYAPSPPLALLSSDQASAVVVRCIWARKGPASFQHCAWGLRLSLHSSCGYLAWQLVAMGRSLMVRLQRHNHAAPAEACHHWLSCCMLHA